MNTTERAIYILSNTNDGDDLAPEHLYLVQCAVNGALSAVGKEQFNALYLNVKSGYSRPWLHGIKNLTKDNEGYVYWKGTQVEHYSFSDAERERESAKEIARRCSILEDRGDAISVNSVVWNWED